MVQEISFEKWDGAGNDFVLLEAEQIPGGKAALDAERVAHWCDRRKGVGADGVLVLHKRPELDAWDLRYLNADGSEAFCGNGTRAAFAYLRASGQCHGGTITLHAFDGLHACRWDDQRDLPGISLRPVVLPVEVGSLMPVRFPAPLQASAWTADTGCPHHVEFMRDPVELGAVDVAATGAMIRHHARFGSLGTNVDFACPIDEGSLAMRSFERGVEAETLACGTGAVAAALADHRRRGGPLSRRVEMKGGTLEVAFDSPQKQPEGGRHEDVWLFGPARKAFAGTVAWSTVLACIMSMALAFLAPSQTLQARGLDVSALSDSTWISVLTGAPGNDLYSSWGHTAIRVQDPARRPVFDLTYNYGTFAFSDGFYLRFMRGDLDYRLSREWFEDFQRNYVGTGRGLVEQRLDLAPADVRAVVAYLEDAALPENATYSYKFFGDNCSSRILLVLEEAFGDRWDARCRAESAATGRTYRDAIAPYIGGQDWIDLGIGLILGPHTDRAMPPCGGAFLPDGLAEQLTKGRLDERPIASGPMELTTEEAEHYAERGSSWPAMLAIFCVLLAAIETRRPGRFSGPWLALSGTLGLLLLLMWTATDHRDTWANWHLMWANPLALAFLSRRFREGPAASRVRAVWGVLILAFVATEAATGAFSGEPWPQVFPWEAWAFMALTFVCLRPWTEWKWPREIRQPEVFALLVMACSAITWTGCRQEPTTWRTEWKVPLALDSIGWTDIFVDSIWENQGANGGLEGAMLVYHGPLGHWSIDELLALPDTSIDVVLSPTFAGGPFQIPPGTEIFSDEDEINFQGVSAQLTEVTLVEGSLFYEVVSTVDGYLDVRYELPGVTFSGSPFVLEESLAPATSEGPASASGVMSMAGAVLDLSGPNGMSFNRLATDLSVMTPLDVEYTALVYGADTVQVHLTFSELSPTSAKGYFGQEEVEIDETLALFDADTWPAGWVNFRPTQFELSFVNYLGADLAIQVNGMTVDGEAVSHPDWSVTQELARAYWANNAPHPSRWTLDLLDLSPDVGALVGQLPRSLSMQAVAQLNPLGDISDGNDFFDARFPPEVRLDLELPLNFAISDLHFRDTIRLDPVERQGFEGAIVVDLTNDFPVAMTVSIPQWDEPVVVPAQVAGESGRSSFQWEISDADLIDGASWPIELRVHSDGWRKFTGWEKVTVRVGIEGTIDHVAE